MGAGELVGLAAVLALLGGGLAWGLMRSSDRPQPSPPTRPVDGPHAVGADNWTWTSPDPCCSAWHVGFGCTRELGHLGCHVAGAGERVAAVWRGEGTCPQCQPQRGWWQL